MPSPSAPPCLRGQQPPQKDLPLFLIDKANTNVARLVELLDTARDWLHAATILERWAVIDTEHNRRFVRALAAAAEPEIISGQLGYKHIAHATPEEIHHAAAWLEGQGKKMADRACALRRRAHQLIA